MENDRAFQKALATAYRFLARRSYSCQELRTKLLQKGCAAAVTEKVIAHVLQQGYLNDEELSLQWALSLVKNRGWGRVKITHYLLRKGIPPELINRVQKKVWQEYNEEDMARSALRRHYRGCLKMPQAEKRARFLKSRGFPADIIYKCLDLSVPEPAEEDL